MPTTKKAGSSGQKSVAGKQSGGGQGKGGNRFEVARKGRESVSQDREHMSEMGCKGRKK